MRVKDGVISQICVHPKIQWAIVEADSIWRRLGRTEGVTVTSLLDGHHKRGSKHYTGEAADLRIRYWTQPQRDLAVKYLVQALGNDFDVVLEPTHIHIEWDPK